LGIAKQKVTKNQLAYHDKIGQGMWCSNDRYDGYGKQKNGIASGATLKIAAWQSGSDL
jgi:hypothetical protein